MTPEEFKKRLDRLQEVVMSALAFYAVWSKLRLHDEAKASWSLDQQNQLLGRWRGFFTSAGLALQRMALIEFAKIFDRDRRTASLEVLLSEAERDGRLIPHGDARDLLPVRVKLQRAKATLKTLRKLRNQRLAHVDANPDPLPPLMSQKIESQAEDIKDAFSRLSVAHDGKGYRWDYMLKRAERDTVEVMRSAMQELQRERTVADAALEASRS